MVAKVLRYYLLKAGVSTFLPTPTPIKIPSDSNCNSTALLEMIYDSAELYCTHGRSFLK
jgi:hypothetical protein